MRSVLKAFNYLLYRRYETLESEYWWENSEIRAFIEFLENIIPYELRALLFHSVEWIFFMKDFHRFYLLLFLFIFFQGTNVGCWKSSSPSNSVAIVAWKLILSKFVKFVGPRSASIHPFFRSKHFEEGRKRRKRFQTIRFYDWRVLILDELRVWKWQVKGTWALNRSLYVTAFYIFRSLVQTPRVYEA